MDVSEDHSTQSKRRSLQAQLVLPGEIISDDPTAMRGHGTYLRDGRIVSSVAGVVERIGKLISVKPLKSRYTGEVGDVVIGRVVEVGNNRWELDLNSRQNADLLIGAVSLHGGIHRRRTVDDALQMRTYFVENDLVVADVQTLRQTGSVSLQVPKSYPKLDNGVLIEVPHTLIKRVKSHFVSLPSTSVDVILGLNGFIWITPTLDEDEVELRNSEDFDPLSWKPKPIPKDLRLNMARVRNAIFVLAQLFLPVSPDHIMYIYNKSLKYSVADLLKQDIMVDVAQGIEAATAQGLGGGAMDTL